MSYSVLAISLTIFMSVFVCYSVSDFYIASSQSGLLASNICRGLVRVLHGEKAEDTWSVWWMPVRVVWLRHTHLPPVPHLLNPWINLMSRGQGQDFNKYPTKLSNLMSAQWMILYVQQTPTAKNTPTVNCLWSLKQSGTIGNVDLIGFVHKHFEHATWLQISSNLEQSLI